MKREWLGLTILWAVLTTLGIIGVAQWQIFPSPSAVEAAIVDRAMMILTLMSVPIFFMVVVLLVYSALRFRHRGEPTADGPHMAGHTGLTVTWVVVTFLLTLLLAGMGSMGLIEIRKAEAEVDQNALVVQVTGSRWLWQYSYPGQDVRSSKELVLPIHQPVRFEITASDVLHSFWIPAFRMKIDAVPGMETVIYATPNKLGDFVDDVSFRVQCSQMCGLAHSNMSTPVRVVTEEAFNAWVQERRKG